MDSGKVSLRDISSAIPVIGVAGGDAIHGQSVVVNAIQPLRYGTRIDSAVPLSQDLQSASLPDSVLQGDPNRTESSQSRDNHRTGSSVGPTIEGNRTTIAHGQALLKEPAMGPGDNPAVTAITGAEGNDLPASVVQTDVNGNIALPATIPGRGPLLIGMGKATDPVVMFGYNHKPDYTLAQANEPGIAWTIEGNYNDGSGQNKTESYLQYLYPDGSGKYNRTFMTQQNRVTNLPTATYLSGGGAGGITFGYIDGVGVPGTQRFVTGAAIAQFGQTLATMMTPVTFAPAFGSPALNITGGSGLPSKSQALTWFNEGTPPGGWIDGNATTLTMRSAAAAGALWQWGHSGAGAYGASQTFTENMRLDPNGWIGVNLGKAPLGPLHVKAANNAGDSYCGVILEGASADTDTWCFGSVAATSNNDLYLTPNSLTYSNSVFKLSAAGKLTLGGAVITKSGTQIVGTSTNPVCSVVGDVGKLWIDTTSTVTTHFKVCAEAASVATWVNVF